MKNSLWKRIAVLVLCLMLLAVLCGCGSEEEVRQAIIGTWSFRADGTKALAEQIAGEMDMEPEPFAELIGEFPLQGTLELKEDGTYKIALDMESLEENASRLLPKLKPIMKDMLIRTLAQEILGDENATQEQLEEALGSTLDEFLSSFVGTDLDSFLDMAMEEMNIEDLLVSLEDTAQEGRYSVDVEKKLLHFSDSLDVQPDEANGEIFTLKDGVVEISEYIGEGFFAQFYPITLTRTP